MPELGNETSLTQLDKSNLIVTNGNFSQRTIQSLVEVFRSEFFRNDSKSVGISVAMESRRNSSRQQIDIPDEYAYSHIHQKKVQISVDDVDTRKAKKPRRKKLKPLIVSKGIISIDMPSPKSYMDNDSSTQFSAQSYNAFSVS